MFAYAEDELSDDSDDCGDVPATMRHDVHDRRAFEVQGEVHTSGSNTSYVPATCSSRDNPASRLALNRLYEEDELSDDYAGDVNIEALSVRSTAAVVRRKRTRGKEYASPARGCSGLTEGPFRLDTFSSLPAHRTSARAAKPVANPGRSDHVASCFVQRAFEAAGNVQDKDCSARSQLQWITGQKDVVRSVLPVEGGSQVRIRALRQRNGLVSKSHPSISC